MKKHAFTEQDLYFIRTHSYYSLDELVRIIQMPKEDIKKVILDFGLKPKTKTAWSNDEIEFLKKYYKSVDINVIISKLHRSKSSIMHKAARLNLTDSNDTIAVQSTWSEKNDDYLLAHLDESIESIAQHLGYSVSTINLHRRKLGITNAKTPWSKKEDDYLIKNYETMPYSKIAKKLHRSYYATKARAQKLGISRYYDFISLSLLARSFNIASKSITCCWIDKYHMPAEKIISGGIVTYHIDTQKFWDWAIEHQNLVPFNKYVRFSLLPEPDNIVQLMENSKIAHKSHAQWTKSEMLRVKNERAKGKSIEQIADEHQRSVNAIKHVLSTKI